MPLPPSTRRAAPHQLTLPFDPPQQPVALHLPPSLIAVSPYQVWNTLTPTQRNELRQQLIQVFQEVLRHANILE